MDFKLKADATTAHCRAGTPREDKHPFIENFCPPRKPNVRGRIVFAGRNPSRRKKCEYSQSSSGPRQLSLLPVPSRPIRRPAGSSSRKRRTRAASPGPVQQGSSRTGASQQDSSGQSNSGNNAASRNSSGGQAATNNQMKGSSRTTMRERSGGARVSVHGRGRTAVGVRSAGGDDVIIHRRHARHYVYGEPSTTVIRKRRYTHYREPARGLHP